MTLCWAPRLLGENSRERQRVQEMISGREQHGKPCQLAIPEYLFPGSLGRSFWILFVLYSPGVAPIFRHTQNYQHISRSLVKQINRSTSSRPEGSTLAMVKLPFFHVNPMDHNVLVRCPINTQYPPCMLRLAQKYVSYTWKIEAR